MKKIELNKTMNIDEEYSYDGKIINCDNENDFVKRIENILNIKNIYISKSDESKYIKKL